MLKERKRLMFTTLFHRKRQQAATQSQLKCEAANNKYVWKMRSEGGREGEREGRIGGEMSEQYVSVATLLKVTEMPGHPARRGESNHAVSVRAPHIA